MSAYYKLIKREQVAEGVSVAHYQPTYHAQGTWNPNDQHMASATGVISHELERFAPQANMRIARISLDILGRIPLEDTTITTRFVRTGRTIALIEAIFQVGGRDCIIARAWQMLTQDTSAVAGLEDIPSVHQPDRLPQWDEMHQWPGGYIESLTLAAAPDRRSGRGMVWMTTDVEVVAEEPVGDFAHLLAMVDTANGIVSRTGIGLDEAKWMFPNTDLQIHMHRAPSGRWLGIDATQQLGDDGVGLTSAVLHDVHGPFGRSEQILTVRPMPR